MPQNGDTWPTWPCSVCVVTFPWHPAPTDMRGRPPQTRRARAGQTAALGGYTGRLDAAGTVGEAGLVRGRPGFGAQSSPPQWVSHKARTTLPQSKTPQSRPSPAGRVRANPTARRFPVLCSSCVCEAPSSRVKGPQLVALMQTSGTCVAP